MTQDREDSSAESTRVTRTSNVVSRTTGGTECLVAIYGVQVGRKFEIDGTETSIGRDPDSCDIVLEADSVSRNHARIELREESRYLVDLDSTNGTFVDDEPVNQPALLKNGMLLKIGDTILKYLKSDHVEAAYFEEVFRMTVVDGLTQIANKRALDTFLSKEMSRTTRHRRDLSVVMMDIDHFKLVNDNFGHLVGDTVLKSLTAMIQERVRREELFARFGGEEFVFVLPETLPDGARIFSERIRQMVENMRVDCDGHNIRITVSMGIALYDREKHKTPDDLIQAADEQLYLAKGQGRNRVCG